MRMPVSLFVCVFVTSCTHISGTMYLNFSQIFSVACGHSSVMHYTSDANALTVTRTNTHLGDRSFSVAGLKLWNSLLELCDNMTLNSGVSNDS